MSRMREITDISNNILDHVREHFNNGSINLTSLTKWVRGEYPDERRSFVKRLTENICIMLQKQSQLTGKCIVELVSTIKITNDEN